LLESVEGNPILIFISKLEINKIVYKILIISIIIKIDCKIMGKDKLIIETMGNKIILIIIMLILIIII
jgi:hypothetical protein